MRSSRRAAAVALWVGLSMATGCGTEGEPAVAAIEGLTVAEEGVLVASDANVFDQAGYSVSISASGDDAAVGVLYDGTPGGYDAGSVRIFHRTGSTWAEVATLVAPDPEDTDQFGHSVSMSADGSRVLIGCSGDYVGGVRTGSARVFHRDGTGTWSQEQALLPVGGAEDDRIGAAVALSGDGMHALVGAYWSDPPSGVDAGSVRAYSRSGSTWTLDQLLYDTGGAVAEWFGFSVAISSDGSRAIIGIPFGNRAVEWNRSGSTWAPGPALAPGGVVSTDEYGRSVALSGDGLHAAVGAWHRDPSQRGAAYVFTRGASTWSLDQTLVPASAGSFDNVGASVGLDGAGARLVIGAPGATVSGASEAGRGHLFTRVGTTWTEQASLLASGTAEANDRLGWYARMSGDGRRAILGMPGDATSAGSARVFTLSGSLGEACGVASDCDSGFCADGVCCSSACGGSVADCQACTVAAGGTSDGTCTALASPASVTCRGSTGTCDAAEHCVAMSLTCPPDGFSPSTTVCHASAGACDPEEHCTGTSATCPSDSLSPSTTVCHASSGACDPEERCTGTSAACPSDSLSPSTTVCHASSGACDPEERCTGTSAACPSDSLSPSTTVCHASSGACDPEERCTGTSAACPSDSLSPSTTVCHASAGACDPEERCTGTSAACPSDSLSPSTTVCHASLGACDPEERCTGTSVTCPTNALATAGTVCGASSGDVCDADDVCDGTSAACPPRFSTVVCRASTSGCDPAESCSGSGLGCPADVTTCMPDAGMPDAGMPDVGMPDAGMPDAGMPDAATIDGGLEDAAVVVVADDAAVLDSDAGTFGDVGVPGDAATDASLIADDAGSDAAVVPLLDAGLSRDAGARDAGRADAGRFDAGSSDAGAGDDAGGGIAGGGCSCRVQTRSSAGPLTMLLAGLALGLVARRRRRGVSGTDRAV